MLNTRFIMVDVSKGIESLTSFKRDTERFRRSLKRNGKPLVLTVNGKAELIVQDAASYQNLLDRVAEAETLKAIEAGLADMRAGRVEPADKVLARIRKKFNIPKVDVD
jgi:PHD/YefM family antitoxin component YafN of YafNO toxin-antitoxin module